MKVSTLVALASLLVLPLLAAAQDGALRTESPGAHEPAVTRLHELITRMHEKTGRQFVLDPAAASVALMPGLDLDRVDYDKLPVILRSHGLVVRNHRELVLISPERDARQLSTAVYTGDDAKVPDDEVITRLVQVRNACAAQMVPVLRPLMPQFAHLAAYPPTNTLILVDHADNVRRVAGLAEKLDKTASGKLDCGEGPEREKK